MSPRRQSIRTRIILLLAVPFTALFVLWAVAASSSLGDALLLLKSKALQDKLITPGQTLVTQLQAERRDSVIYLGSVGGPGRADAADLHDQWAVTDRLRTAYAKDVGSGQLHGVQSEVLRRARSLVAQLGRLDQLRAGITSGEATRLSVMTDYSTLIAGVYDIYDAVLPGNSEIASSARDLTMLGRARELLSQDDALVAGVLAHGKMTLDERHQIIALYGEGYYEYTVTVPLLSPADQDAYLRTATSLPVTRFQSLEKQMENTSRLNHLPISLEDWNGTASAVDNQLYDYENHVLASLTSRAQHIAVGVLVRLALTAGLGLVAVLLSIFVAVRVGRRIIREARTLSGAVEVFSADQLPLLAERVKRGEVIEADGATILPPGTFRVTEIETLSASFDAARQAVVAAARSEAAARKGVSDLFINLARRNQALLHRQLGLLDAMERRAENPGELADLFRLDHLATCMRRHAEGLVTLAGKPAGRTWRTPVPIVDVARAAVAEVDDYTRVQVQALPRAFLAGAAVADTIHLLAELIENAVMFSPPAEQVTVTAHLVPSGLAFEVVDHGLGMDPGLLAELNGRLGEVQEFDLFDSARLGTFVVSRLADRHGVRVSLRSVRYGGTTAIALLPAELIVTEPTEGMPIVSPETTAEDSGREPAFVGPVRVATPDPTDLHAGLPRRRRSRTTAGAPADVTSVAAAPGIDQTNGSGTGTTHRAAGQRSAGDGETAAGEGTLGVDGKFRTAGDAVREEGVPELPRRERQAHIAPQLRDELREQGAEQTSGRGRGPGARSPEEVRSMMSAMQQGWQRGRAVDPNTSAAPEEDPR